MAIKYYRRFLAISFLVTSCRSASRTQPEPSTEKSPTPLPAAAAIAARESWVIQPTADPHKYRASVTSSIVMDQASAFLQDSTALTTDFTVSITRDTRGASYSILVDGLSLRPATRAAATAVPELSSPVSFTGRLEPARASLGTSLDCNNQVSSAVPIIQRTLFLVPLQLRRGQTWSDSTSLAACSGSIPVMLTTLRRYQVVGETNNGIILERLDKTSSIGEGTEGQHRVQLRGEGSGQTQLLIDPATGTLLDASGTNTTLATITTSGRSQNFTQTSREHVTRR